jgi:hypothetical protein
MDKSIQEYIINCASWKECRKLERVIQKRKKILKPKSLDLGKVKYLVDLPHSYWSYVEWQKDILKSLNNRFINDFEGLFTELVPNSNHMTHTKAARAFEIAYNRLTCQLIAEKEAELEANKRQSNIVIEYNPATDRYESQYRT